MLIPVTLAIDFGTKRIGLARSYASLAEPLKVIRYDEKIWDVLKGIIEEEQIAQVVVGISENEMAVKSRAFGLEVTKRLKLPVYYMDETLSSKVAHTHLEQLSQTRPGERSVVDHLAAATFLQEWLDTQAATQS